MAKTGNTTVKPSEPPKTADTKRAEDKAKIPPPPLDEDDYEDGDIATPKRDRYGPDDEPL
ncbi:hypothetical protein ACSHT2_19075 [Bradyrhizobium sp. PUT101]|uniref:hypothetical protein n=1 Tax=Bradyrhizobium sp. PUT101 TaxID=3447427 RepID=UPI003F84B2C6